MLTPNELVDHFDKGKAWLKDLSIGYNNAEKAATRAKAQLSEFVRDYYIVNYCETNNKSFVSEEGVFYFVHYGYVHNELHKLSTMRWEDIPDVIRNALHTPIKCLPFQTTLGAITESYCPEHLKYARHAEEVRRD